jgi:tetratricopeptide (TPR) repeat protein
VPKAHSVQERLLTMEDGGIWDILRSWVQFNQHAIGIVVGGILLLAVASFYWSHQKASGLESLRKGIVTLQEGDAQKALNDLQEAGRSSLSNTERALGLFYLGEANTTLGRKEDASKAYEAALAVIGTNKSESYLRQLLLIKVAQSAENTGADADARQKYETAAGLGGPLKAEALVAAARLADKLNDSGGAKAHYEQLVREFPTHPLLEVFQGKIGN